MPHYRFSGLKRISHAACCPNLTSISLWGVTAITDDGVMELVWKRGVERRSGSKALKQFQSMIRRMKLWLRLGLRSSICALALAMKYSAWTLGLQKSSHGYPNSQITIPKLS
eukprot:c23642_g2_i4 orf=100-435(-)